MNTKCPPSDSDTARRGESDGAGRPDEKTTRSLAFRHPTILLFLGAIFYWGSLPPVTIWPLAFLVPLVWTVLILRARRPRLRTVYATAFVFWIASIWWVACPHPLTSLGLVALAGYLAIYWPLFFVATRTAVHRFRVPVVAAAPVCWVGCEYLRNHLLGGFSFCALEHALYLQPKFIQTADLFGSYTVGGMVVLVGAGFGAAVAGVLEDKGAASAVSGDYGGVPSSSPALPAGLVSSLVAVTVLLGAVLYGNAALKRPVPDGTPTVRLATLQGNIPVRIDAGPEQIEATFKQFVDLTRQAVRDAAAEGNRLDLVVWPETVCPIPAMEFRGVRPEQVGLTQEHAKAWREQLTYFADEVDTPILFGLSTFLFDTLPEGDEPEPKRLNSALLVAPDTGVGSRYDKVHLVMFGEYIPFSGWLPKNFFLKTLCQEAARGTGPVAMELRGTGRRACVNICFESSVPHLVRRQVLRLKAQGQEPSLLINMSNDGWFRFSRQIDQHLATHVFRAVENRRPYVTATNGGFSAVLDSRGRVRRIGRRRAAEAVVDEPALDAWTPPYHAVGDVPAGACAAAVLLLLILQRMNRSRVHSEPRPPGSGCPA